MNTRQRLLAGFAMMGMCAGLSAQQTDSFAAQSPQPPPGTPPASQAPATNYDPLAFYRKNPELMRRYFPHLVQGNNPLAPQVPGGPSPALYSVDFPGDTAQDLINVLKAIIQPPPNIMIAPNLRDREIPPFYLQNVALADIFQALNSLSEDKSTQWVLSGSTEPIWILTPVSNPTAGIAAQGGGGGRYGAGMAGFGGAGVSSFPPAVDPVTGQPITGARACQILPVGKYLGKFKVEDITTAVKTAWGMMGDETGAQMKYHKDTNLLIAVGTGEQLSVLNQVLSSLDSSLEDSKVKATEIPIPGKVEN